MSVRERADPAGCLRAMNGLVTSGFVVILLITLLRVAVVFVTSESVVVFAEFVVQMGKGLFVLAFACIVVSALLKSIEHCCER